MTREFVTDDERPTVTYGPDPDAPGYVLRVTCESEMVEIALDEDAMYQLWTEVKDTPWPERDMGEKPRLVRQVVHAATGADEEMLKDALETLGVRR